MNLGLAGLQEQLLSPTSVAGAAQPNYEQLINDAYAGVGRTGIGADPNQIDQEGYNYWLGQLQTGAIKPDQFQNYFNTGAETAYINQAYQDLFGRGPEESGLQYWQNQLNTTNKNDIYNAIGAGAMGDDKTAFENYQKSQIEQAYKDLFGREAEESGLDYWLNKTDLVGDSLINALREGAMGADIGSLYGINDADISSEVSAAKLKDLFSHQEGYDDFHQIYSVAEQYNVDPETAAALLGYTPEQTQALIQQYGLGNIVAREYGDIGRDLTGRAAIDEEGFNYWMRQLQSGAITPEQFEQVFLNSAIDVVGKGYDADVTSRTVAESLAKGYGGADLIDKANPLDIYETLGREGQTVESLTKLYPNLNPQQITDMLAKVPDLYGDYISSTFDEVLGTGVSDRISDEYRQNAINNFVTGEITRDEFLEELQNSGANKNQEAQRVASSYITMYGGNQDDANALYARLMGIEYTGPGTVKEDIYKTAKAAFDTSLSDENAGIESLVRNAANLEGAENNEFFKNNPNALLVYGDLKKRNDSPWFTYGEINGAPILKADSVDKYMEMVNGGGKLFGGGNLDTNSASNFAHRGPDRMGIGDIGTAGLGGGSSFIRRGPALFDITQEPVTVSVPRMVTQTDESGNTYQVHVWDGESPAYDNVPTGEYTYTGDLNAAAQKVGLDPANFKNKEALYDAINEISKNLYLIGSQNPANPNEKSPDNFMYTLYQRTEDGKLIPVNEPTYYEGVVNPDVFKKKGALGGGFFGDMLQGFAGIPFLPELAMLIPGAGPMTYAALKAAQTGAYSNSFKDIGKSAGLAYLSAKFLPEVTKDVSKYFNISNPIINQAITQGTVGSGMSMLTGGSGTEGFTSGAISGAVGGGLDMANSELRSFAINDLNVDPKFASVFANTLSSLAPTLLTGGKIDPTKVLMNYMMKQALSGARNTYSASGTGTPNNYIDTGAMDNRDVVAP